jgi:adenosylcobalamin-dependent ribonucleoside-triphosphate reductase
MVWDVEDNRLGWAQIIENLECIAYLAHKDPEYRFEYSTVYIDFSKVRPKGTPIKGVQNKPAPGPKAFIETIVEIHDYVQATKNNPDPLWKQAMIIDDYIAQCVLAGGSRRSSRIACKSWDDEGIFDFIHIKAQGGLQTANNSVLATEEFWNGVESGEELASRVFNEICDNAYHQGTGEPAIINQHKLEENREGLEGLTADNIINKDIYNMTAVAKQLYTDLIEVAKNRRFIMIVNPCSEINLHFLCGYCILFDLAPFHCELGNSEEYKAARVAARSLVRANKMPALYQFEVNRTNRVGISLTGIFEYAYHHFGVSFLDLVNSDLHQPAQPNSREEKAKLFFNQLGHMRNSIIADMQYMKLKNPDFVIPHTLFTIKPSGSVSKLFNLTEGAHLPSMRHYLRWVAMTTEDPLVKEYEELGYPVKHLKSYKNTAVVGFPTAPRICEFVPPNHIVTAGEASPDQQYTWLQRIEKYWLGDQYGGQISYTLKFDPEEISYEKFKEDILTYHRDVKCCSWMFQSKTDIANMLTKYEYLPEEPIPYDRFSEIMVKVEANRNRKHSEVHEQVDLALLECQNGYCPL